MKYGYEITIDFLDNHQDIALCVIKNTKDFDTVGEAGFRMDELAGKLNLESPFYIKSKEITTKQEYSDPLINIKTDGLEPELEKFMIDLMEKMVKEHGRSND